jgi:hypothetical protein
MAKARQAITEIVEKTLPLRSHADTEFATVCALDDANGRLEGTV